MPINRLAATGNEATNDAAYEDPIKRRKQATKPTNVPAALGDGGGGEGLSGGRFNGPGSIDSSVMRVTSVTSMCG
jgi:hypothetical protein